MVKKGATAACVLKAEMRMHKKRTDTTNSRKSEETWRALTGEVRRMRTSHTKGQKHFFQRPSPKAR
jgi:hypothetical protein